MSTRIGCPRGPTAWRNSTTCRLSVDPRGVGAPLGGEDLRLELLQLLLDVLGDLLVLVDDGVADPVQHGRGPVAQQVRHPFEPAADRVEHAAAPVLHGHHEVLPGEQHDLPADQLGPRLVEVQRLEHHEQALVVDVELGPLVGVHRVLDRERVRGEIQREVVELVVGRLVQPEPDEAARHAAGLPDGLGHADRLPPTVGVEGAVHEHPSIVIR